MPEKRVLGIDIGGTNIAFGLVTKNGQILEEFNVKTASIKEPSTLPEIIKNYIGNSQITAVGIGAPSSNYFTGRIENAPNLNWGENIPLANYFEKEFKVKTILTNDANAAAVGEQLFGVAKGMTNFVSITLGTGLGSGIIINNELVYGNNGTAGEYGHVIIEKNGRLCGCSRKGCLETYCSTTGFLRSVKELAHTSKKDSKLLNDSYSPESIFRHAEEGDVFANYIVDYTAEKLGFSLANFAAFSNPEAFILFGGIAQNGEFFRKKVEQYMNQNLLNLYQRKTKVLTSALHNKNAAILGAAAIAFKEIV